MALYTKSDPPCEDKCDRPALLKENIEVYTLLCRYGPLMMGEDIKAEGIRFVLDEEGYTNPTDRLILIRKIISYLSSARSTSMTKLNKPMSGNTKKDGVLGKRGK